MKKATFLFLALLIGTMSYSQTITQSLSQTFGSNSAALPGEVSYFRIFDLESHDVIEDYVISSIEFGVAYVSGPPNVPASCPITVRLYSTTGEFPQSYFSKTLLAEEIYTLTDLSQVIYIAPIQAVVPAGKHLIVELTYVQTATGNIYLGYNEDGETAPTYFFDSSVIGALADAVGMDLSLILNVVGTTETAGLNNNLKEMIKLYPNPTDDVVNIELNGLISPVTAILTDSLGRNIVLPINSSAIDISGFEGGVYYLTISSPDGISTTKIVKN